LVVDFDATPEAVAALLPPRLEVDPDRPGGCAAFFVAWQYASDTGEEWLDPARSQYNELILLVNAVYRGRQVQTCPARTPTATSAARG
jgi:acetoacetate decarboxylase